MQVRKRHAIVLQWEDAVRQKRLYKNVDGTAKSAVDEQKALQKAKRDEEEAIQKTMKVKQAIGVLRKESMMFKGRVQRLATSIQSDIPHAVHSLDNMMTHIEQYLSLQTAGEGISLGDSAESISRAAASEKVGLERMRDRTPKPADREAAVQTLITPDHPILSPWKLGVMQDWQKQALGGLSIDRQLPDLEARVVLYPGVWEKQRVYLERLDPANDADSGWYIGPAEDNAPSGEPPASIAVRLADIIAARPDFGDLLSLPNGSLIVVDSGGPSAIFDQLGLDIWSLALIQAAQPPVEAPTEKSADETPAETVESKGA
jgi:hypothetical protein